MTIESTITGVIHAGDGEAVSFAVPWRIFDRAWLHVRYLESDGSERQLILDSEYTVSGVGEAAGSIRLTDIVPAEDEYLSITPDIPPLQLTDLIERGAYHAETVETRLDIITQMVAQLRLELMRAPMVSVFDGDLAGLLLPIPEAGKALGWSSEADALVNLAPGSVSLADGAVTTAKLAANAVTAAKIADGSVTAGKIAASVLQTPFTASVDAAGYTFSNALLRGTRETVAEADVTGGVLTVDAAPGSIQHVTLAANVTGVTFAGFVAGTCCAVVLYIKQDGTGGRTIAWPASVKWSGGTAPVLSTGAAKTDVVMLTSLDGGTTVHGLLSDTDLAGLAFA
ncbi:MAG: hypothetical protein KDH19_06500 [Geminicoccaceae bacterium]|nr:hypothetical protein [Geminicoccaceae bacterium]